MSLNNTLNESEISLGRDLGEVLEACVMVNPVQVLEEVLHDLRLM